MKKQCTGCNTRKELDAFPRRAKGKHGRDSKCQVCHNESVTTWRAENKERWGRYMKEYRKKNADRIRESDRRRWLMTKYGITPKEYDELLVKHDSNCHVCHKPSFGRLIVDHDHVTGQIRGLLCHGCNLGIGHLQDDPEVMASALDYVRKGRQNSRARFKGAKAFKRGV